MEHTRYLIENAVRKQMLSDVPVCTFLSGGVDSSLVTAICSSELKKQGKVLSTYSFDFKDNDINFQANNFQPSQDRPWVDVVRKYADTQHFYLECRNEELYDYLLRRWMPGICRVWLMWSPPCCISAVKWQSSIR